MGCSKYISVFLLAAFVAISSAAAGDAAKQHVAASWQSLSVKKGLGEDFSLTLRGEYRCKDDFRCDDLWFIRLTAGYKLNSHFSTALSADWFNVSQTLSQRGEVTLLPWMKHSRRLLADVSGKMSYERWTLAQRERYVYGRTSERKLDAYDGQGLYCQIVQPAAGSMLLRSLTTLSYKPADSCLSPYVAAELFNSLQRGDGMVLQQCHIFAGTGIKLDAVNTLKLYYVCQVKQPSGKHLHTLAVDYVITLP